MNLGKGYSVYVTGGSSLGAHEKILVYGGKQGE